MRMKSSGFPSSILMDANDFDVRKPELQYLPLNPSVETYHLLKKRNKTKKFIIATSILPIKPTCTEAT